MQSKLLRALLAAATTTLALPASQAAVIQLDFESVGNFARIENHYSGGTDSLGNAGTNYGVAFGANTLAVKESEPTANFSLAPSGETIMFFLTGTAILNYAPGFTEGFSFFYSSVTFASRVQVYDGLDATGNLLGEISLAALGYGPDPDNPYSNWAVGALEFAGVAKSINFGGTVNRVGYDNITFGSSDPSTLAPTPVDPNPVPEPSSLALVLAGALALRRRFR